MKAPFPGVLQEVFAEVGVQVGLAVGEPGQIEAPGDSLFQGSSS